MTSYFDELNSEVRGISDEADRETFLHYLGNIEARVIATINLVTGDREFPHELREKLQGIIATRCVQVTVVPNQKAIDYAWACKLSLLIDDLHFAFHRVASLRIETRFGRLSDNPDEIVKRRDEHDAEGGAS